jgi:hypothetical protein
MGVFYSMVLDPARPEEYYNTPFVACPIRPEIMAVMKTDFHICWDPDIQRYWYFDRRPINTMNWYCYGLGKTVQQAKTLYELRMARWAYNELLQKCFGNDVFDMHKYPLGMMDTRAPEVLPT